jgi:protein TonB
MASGTISVARILQLRVPIAWQEAVEVAHAAQKLAANDPGGLTLTGCVLTEHGTVTLVPGPAATHLTALQLLGRMLQGQAAPPELRALVTSAEDGLDSFPSEQDSRPRAKELSLDWFLRPHPAVEIAKLASRALAAESAQQQSTALQKLRAEVLEQRHRPDPPKAPPPVPPRDWRHEFLPYWRGVLLAHWQANWPPRREVQVAAAALLAVVAVAWSALGRAWFAGPEPLAGVPQTRWIQAMAAVANAPAVRAPAVPSAAPATRQSRESLPTTGNAAMNGEAPIEPDPASEPAAARVQPANVATLLVKAEDGTVIRTRELQVVYPTEPAPARPVVSAPTAAAAAAANDRSPMTVPSPERLVYSAEDPGVAPPEMLRPHLPSERKADSEPSDSWVEVIVDERGQVARVRLHSSDASLNDRMLVAAAKAWQFQPARKDGRPVKYVLRVPVTY